MTDRPADIVLPCGCHITHPTVNGISTMQIAACREGCVNVRNAIAYANETGKPVEKRYR